jgi:hypothetical protein
MIRKAFLAGMIALSAAVPALAAGDPAALAAIEPLLRDDEKAMLAAVLADKNVAADFNADVKFAAGDPKVTKLVLDKWRGYIVAYAEKDSKIATPDLEGTYKNYGALMTPPTRAYMLRRLKTMKEADRNSLIEYLDGVDSALAGNNNKLTWYTKKVVSGIFDKYRQDLGTYLPEPIAQNAKASAPAAARALAELRKPKEEPAAVVVAPPANGAPVVPPILKPPVKKPVVAAPPSGSALEDAKRAAAAAERAGPGFDGGGAVPPASGGVVAGGDGLPRAPLDPPSKLGGTPTLTADVPSPVDPDEDFISSVKGMKTGSGPMQPRQYLPGGLGALLGGILGFFLGGPVGALIGAGLGLIAGDVIGGKLFK